MRPFLFLFACWLLAAARPAGAAGDLTALCAELREAYGVAPSMCSEKAAGADPLAGVSQTLRQDNVFFPRGGVALDPTAQDQLKRLARALATPLLADACLRLVGHADARGGREANRRIGLARAETVRDALVRLGVAAGRLEVASLGEEAPLPDFPPEDRRQRRVALLARHCPDGAVLPVVAAGK